MNEYKVMLPTKGPGGGEEEEEDEEKERKLTRLQQVILLQQNSHLQEQQAWEVLWSDVVASNLCLINLLFP